MALPRRTGRSRLTLALLIITSIAVLTLDFRDTGLVEGARRAAGTVFSPLRGAAETVTSPFSNGWNGITDYGDVKAENERLRRELDEQRGKAVEGETAIQELEDVMAELGITYVADIPRTTAQVVAGPISNFAHTIEIDKGADDGIKVNMPVISGAGLVGQVQAVTGSSATIQLLSDPEFRVGVRLLPQGVVGTASGAGEGHPLTVDTGIDGDEPLEPGGTVTTSGSDRSRFPASIPVGTVRGTEKSGGGLTLNLIVEPFADTERLSYVTVLLWEGEG